MNVYARERYAKNPEPQKEETRRRRAADLEGARQKDRERSAAKRARNPKPKKKSAYPIASRPQVDVDWEAKIGKDTWIDFRGVSGVYAIENLVNGKVYIGQAQDIYKRWHTHLTAFKKEQAAKKLMNAVRKHGIENFRFILLEKCPTDALNDREQVWIDTFDAVKSGYNVCPTAGSVRGTKQAPERVERTSRRMLEQWTDLEWARKTVDACTQSRRTERSRAKSSANATAQWASDTRKAMVEGLTAARRAKSPLTVDDVLEIRRRFTRYCKVNGGTALAKEFGVSGSYISNIIDRKVWKDV